MNLKEHTEKALRSQDACNASGVARSLVHWFDEFEAVTGLKGTDARNEHFVTCLYVDKLAHLARCQERGNERVMQAYLEAYAALPGDPK